MSGERNLSQLLIHLKPQLANEAFVYVSILEEDFFPTFKFFACIKEPEGYTLVLEKKIADQQSFVYSYVAAKITMQIHSALDAVGLTAVLAKQLAMAGISCNVIAGYYHDHLFVDYECRYEALEALQALS